MRGPGLRDWLRALPQGCTADAVGGACVPKATGTGLDTDRCSENVLAKDNDRLLKPFLLAVFHIPCAIH